MKSAAFYWSSIGCAVLVSAAWFLAVIIDDPAIRGAAVLGLSVPGCVLAYAGGLLEPAVRGRA